MHARVCRALGCKVSPEYIDDEFLAEKNTPACCPVVSKDELPSSVLPDENAPLMPQF